MQLQNTHWSMETLGNNIQNWQNGFKTDFGHDWAWPWPITVCLPQCNSLDKFTTILQDPNIFSSPPCSACPHSLTGRFLCYGSSPSPTVATDSFCLATVMELASSTGGRVQGCVGGGLNILYSGKVKLKRLHSKVRIGLWVRTSAQDEEVKKLLWMACDITQHAKQLQVGD